MRNTFFIIVLGLALGCGDDGSSNNNNGDGDGGNNDGDGGNNDGDGGNNPGIDAAVVPCTPGLTQCSDCVDNDADGRIDGADIECISAADLDEGSFATGIPGDNSDPNKQDCFFDGNSGTAPGGMDECIYDTCCLFPPGSGSECAPGNPTCDVSQACVDFCMPAAPPGCDCFGCCTVCDDAGCETIITNESIVETDPSNPDACTQATIHDPSKCFPCVQDTECGQPCDPANCILCPGQDPSDLPAGCNDTAECPAGQTPCQSTDECGAGAACISGCCVSQIG